MAVRLIDSITSAGEAERGAAVLAGSHGGAIAAAIASARGVRAAIFSDAGGGLDGAGVAGLAALEAVGMAAAAVAAASARIGEAEDMARRGLISAVNAGAAACGVAEGMAAARALALLEAGAPEPAARLAVPAEARREGRAGGAALLLVDSASLLRAEDAGRIAVTGSHGGLPAARAAEAGGALRLAAFNDAGFGADGAGVAGLALLERGGVAAVTVSHATARIGEAASTLGGVISAANGPAREMGLAPGSALAEAIAALGPGAG